MTTEDDLEKFANVIGVTLNHVADEALILSRFEEFINPKPASIFDGIKEEEIDEKIGAATEMMGGPPKVWLMLADEPSPIADTYPESTFQEAVSIFWRARKSVCRAHLYCMATQSMKDSPEYIFNDQPEELKKIITRAATGSFWENAETGYLRLASYWDRIGQILDFRFFRIRQFERDGFTAVMDRIHSNVKPVSIQLSNSDSWKLIRKFQTSEKDEGLKWLLRRRNILVHSLHLRAAKDSIDEVAFKPMYNHLEEKLKSRLAPRTPEEEVKQLYLQLSQAANLFPHVINVICSEEDKPTPPLGG